MRREDAGVAFLADYSGVDRIIDHLKLTFVAAKPPPSHIFSEVTRMAAVQSVDHS